MDVQTLMEQFSSRMFSALPDLEETAAGESVLRYELADDAYTVAAVPGRHIQVKGGSDFYREGGAGLVVSVHESDGTTISAAAWTSSVEAACAMAARFLEHDLTADAPGPTKWERALDGVVALMPAGTVALAVVPGLDHPVVAWSEESDEQKRRHAAG